MELISIQLNGETRSVSTKNLKELIDSLNLDKAGLALALNNQVIPSAEYPLTELKPGDCIEIVKPVCGG